MDYVINLVDIPVGYYLVSIGLAILVGAISKRWTRGLLVGYLFFALAVTVLHRPGGLENPAYRLELFWSWKIPCLRQEIIMNIIAFIPIGLLAGIELGWKGIILAACFSMCIEVCQLIFHRGLFEFDDIIHNSLGAIIGYGVWKIYTAFIGNKNRKNNDQSCDQKNNQKK